MNSRFWSATTYLWVAAPIVFIALSWLLSWLDKNTDANEAAWVQAIGSILAIVAAILIPFFQRQSDRSERESENRKMVMSAATNLYVALKDARMFLGLAPSGDGHIGHDMKSMEQALRFIKIQSQTWEALRIAVDKAHYFDEKLCAEIVLLSLAGVAYDSAAEDYAMMTDNIDEFFSKMVERRLMVLKQIDNVDSLLGPYLPT